MRPGGAGAGRLGCSRLRPHLKVASLAHLPSLNDTFDTPREIPT